MKKWLENPAEGEAEAEDLVPESVIQRLNKWAREEASGASTGRSKPAGDEATARELPPPTQGKDIQARLSLHRPGLRHRKRGSSDGGRKSSPTLS
jgi:hypothetical protein